MGIELITPTEKDFERIRPLFAQLWPSKEINEHALYKVFARASASDTDVLLCAAAEGGIVGFCAYAVVNNLWQEGQIAYVYAMVVDENCRGQGIGSQLLSEAVCLAKEQGLKRVELDSGFHRERAHEFYEKFGFEKRAFLFSYLL